MTQIHPEQDLAEEQRTALLAGELSVGEVAIEGAKKASGI